MAAMGIEVRYQKVITPEGFDSYIQKKPRMFIGYNNQRMLDLMIQTQSGIFTAPTVIFDYLIDESMNESTEDKSHENTTNMIMEHMSYAEYMDGFEKYIAPERSTFDESITGVKKQKDAKFTKSANKIDDIIT
jgi:hypothetical protein